MKMQSIIAEKREILGKKVKNLRKQGFLPAVLYGKGKKTEPISIKEADFLKLWKSAGESSIITLELGKDKKNVLIQDVTFDPIRDNPIHADFYQVDMEKEIKVSVPLEFVGESEAVRLGGILVKIMHALNIEALPKDLPHAISVDISQLKEVNSSLSVRDIKIPAGVKKLDGLDETIVKIEPPRSEEEIKAESEAPSLENIEIVGKKEKEAEALAKAEAEKAE